MGALQVEEPEVASQEITKTDYESQTPGRFEIKTRKWGSPKAVRPPLDSLLLARQAYVVKWASSILPCE